MAGSGRSGRGEEQEEKHLKYSCPEQSSLCHYNNVCTLIILFPDIFNTDGETIVEMCLCAYNKVVWALYESLLFPFFLPNHSEALVTGIAGKKRDKQLRAKAKHKGSKIGKWRSVGGEHLSIATWSLVGRNCFRFTY